MIQNFENLKVAENGISQWTYKEKYEKDKERVFEFLRTLNGMDEIRVSIKNFEFSDFFFIQFKDKQQYMNLEMPND